MREIFVLVPSMQPTGPVKGAIALANALADARRITLVALKPGPGADAPLSKRVRFLELGDRSCRQLIDTFEAAGGRRGATMVSYCLSADLAALQLRRHARWISSVRGNLPENYRFDYGRIGPYLAAVQLTTLRLADQVIAMTHAMAGQIAVYTGYRPTVIRNFVDEAPLEPLRQPASQTEPFRFVFLGSLTPRKQPLLLLDALRQLMDWSYVARLDLLGDGPLWKQLLHAVDAKSLSGAVTTHGSIKSPHAILAAADALVLPSLSEGISRAALEALQLGVPVVLRNVDGNRELLHQGENGVLFNNDRDLPAAMLEAAQLRRARGASDSLLPPEFRQQSCAAMYLAMAEPERADA